MNLKEQIREAAFVKGLYLEENQIDDVNSRVESTLYELGVDQIINETLDNVAETHKYLTWNDIKVGETYVVKDIEGVKKKLRNKEVVVVKVQEEAHKTVSQLIVEDSKGSQYNLLGPNMLKIKQ